MLSRKRMYQIGAIIVVVVGTILVGVGTAGVGVPFILGGLVCIMVGGGVGIVASLDARP